MIDVDILEVKQLCDLQINLLLDLKKLEPEEIIGRIESHGNNVGIFFDDIIVGVQETQMGSYWEVQMVSLKGEEDFYEVKELIDRIEDDFVVIEAKLTGSREVVM